MATGSQAEHDHGHQHQEQTHARDEAAHNEHDHDEQGHQHERGGLGGLIERLGLLHGHSHATPTDAELESSAAGIRTVKMSLLVLAITAMFQIGVVVISGSVALLADTIHNFTDALTALPLWLAFILGRRAASR